MNAKRPFRPAIGQVLDRLFETQCDASITITEHRQDAFSFVVRLLALPEGYFFFILHNDPEGIWMETATVPETVLQATTEDELADALDAIRFPSEVRPVLNRFDGLLKHCPTLF